MKAVIFLLVIITQAASKSILEPVNEQNEDDGYFLMTGESDDDDSYAPLLPRMNREDKWELIRASGQDPLTRKRGEKFQARHRDRRGKRDILLAPWRLAYAYNRQRAPAPVVDLNKPLVALPVDTCPQKFDAITKGYNGRTYLFGRDRVYQIWNDDGLPQKSSFLITDLFPGGPRTVTAALTNSRSGVTILLEGRKAYRFRWNRKGQRFQLAKNTPQDLPRNITINPTIGFEWSDGNQILLSRDHFIIYDAYWNLATFTGHTKKYFPNLPTDILGIVYNDKKSTLLIYTKSNKLKVFNTKKFKVVQEYPLKINEYAGCLIK